MKKKNGQNNRHRTGNHATGLTILGPNMGTAAEMNSSAFSAQNVSDAIPKTFEERAAKAWQFYTEEPIVQNAINSWRTFAIGDEIQFNCDDEDVKWEAREFAARVQLNKLIKDSVLQCLVKGETVCFKRPTKDGKDIEEVVCVNPISVKVKYENGKLVEAKQTPETAGSAEPIDLPLEQTLHIKWNAPSYSPRGNSMVVTAFESIELLRDYRSAERAVAKRWTTPLRFIQVGGQFGQKTIVPDQRSLNSVRDMLNRMDMKAGLVVPFYVKADPSRRAGYRHQMRFDITDEMLERELKGYGLYHNVTDNGDVEDLVKTVLENNGNMVSTVEKIRIGVKPGGMSPVSDMGTGGASYFFTRVRKLPTGGGRGSTGLYFKKRLLRRMDAITYDHDAFGKVVDDYVRRKRLASIEDYKRLASGGRSDETIFKYTVSLVDEIDVIKTSGAAQRAKVIELFKKKGFSKLPDGRKIEEVVL